IQWLTAQQNPLDVQESSMIEMSSLSVAEAKKVFGRSYPKAERSCIRAVPKQNRET
uniref:Uncharacterized protein n=1 Tax=Caenorhabditis japonica TaxID=281687 RepID=A0A8R1I935_CAEJA